MKPPSKQEIPIWTISKLITWTTDYFISQNIESPRIAAELLLAHCLKIKRLDLYLQHDKPLTQSELAHYKSLIKRRVNREPVAYITGVKGFWNLDLEVSENVLIPRPDTECLIEAALEVIPKSSQGEMMHILDLGTGSGAIILSLASERSENCCFYAVDISHHASMQALKNRNNNHFEKMVSFITGNWFGPFKKQPFFDVIVSNPPYIPRADIDGLEPEIRNHEPFLALDGDTDGLRCIRDIIGAAPYYLNPGGCLLMEIGFDQKEQVRMIAEGAGCFEHIEFIKDYAGHHRVVKMNQPRYVSIK